MSDMLTVIMTKIYCLLRGHDYYYAGTLSVNGSKYRCYTCVACGKQKKESY